MTAKKRFQSRRQSYEQQPTPVTATSVPSASVPAQDSDALAAQLRQAVGDAQAEAALDALYRRQQQQASGTLDRQETATFYDLKNQHPQASLILSAAHDWDLLCQTCQWVTEHPDAFGRHHPGCRL